MSESIDKDLYRVNIWVAAIEVENRLAAIQRCIAELIDSLDDDDEFVRWNLKLGWVGEARDYAQVIVNSFLEEG